MYCLFLGNNCSLHGFFVVAMVFFCHLSTKTFMCFITDRQNAHTGRALVVYLRAVLKDSYFFHPVVEILHLKSNTNYICPRNVWTFEWNFYLCGFSLHRYLFKLLCWQNIWQICAIYHENCICLEQNNVSGIAPLIKCYHI